ncbi:MAG: ROK family protein [Clostridia bacterium]|nr:ROK family protein [Clostridia bacterium]
MNIGIDIGGSHIGIGVVDSNGNIKKRKDIYIGLKEKTKIRKYILEEIVKTIDEWCGDKGKVRKIGIAAPGIIMNGNIKYSVNLGLSNYDLKKLLLKHYPNANIRLKNDAKCAALAEKNLGALKNHDNSVFICLGTGIGGAFFYNGRLISPRRGSGAEFGHMIIKRNGRACRCGNRGCFEQYGSMRVFKSRIKSCLNLSPRIEGEKLRKAIEDNIDNKDVKRIIDTYLDDVCLGLSNIVNILEPDTICIGGGFSKYEELLLDLLKERFKKAKYLFYKKNVPNIVVAKLGNNAGIIGAALYI